MIGVRWLSGRYGSREEYDVPTSRGSDGSVVSKYNIHLQDHVEIVLTSMADGPIP